MTILSNAALDAIFEPRGSTTKLADVGLQTAGVDISNRYMQPSQGGTATAPNTNLQSSGVDISTLFTALGTVILLPNILWAGLVALSVSASGVSTATSSITLNSDGSVSTLGAGTTTTEWLDAIAAGNGNDFECRYLNLTGSIIGGPSTFTALSSNQVFSLNGVSSKTSQFDVEIREIGNAGSTEIRNISLEVVITGGGGILL